jgi:hypothetical protein
VNSENFMSECRILGLEVTIIDWRRGIWLSGCIK